MKPKKVALLSRPLPDHTAGKVASQSPYKDDLVDFIRRIENGLELPDSFYRTAVDDTPDELLAVTGVKHVISAWRMGRSRLVETALPPSPFPPC